MGEAIIAAIIEKKLARAGDIRASDLSRERLERLSSEYGINTTSDNLKAVKGSEVIILAVKPQNLATVTAEISGKLKVSQLVISIIAGKSLKILTEGLKHDAIVRAMPNTPAQVGMGMTVWTAAESITEEQKKLAASILGAMGMEILVEDEKYLNMATAVSGSGPAYFFYFMEALTEAAEEIGFSPKMARILVLMTAWGSASYAIKSKNDLSELRTMVTSPGGTTAAAIKALEDGSLNKLVRKAVKAALKRAEELGS